MGKGLSQDQFEALLGHLGPDREEAGLRYEELRDRVITIFKYRGCANPEELADETMDRVARKLLEQSPLALAADPLRYVCGVAWNLVKEAHKPSRMTALPERWEPANAPHADGPDVEHDCLDRCLLALPRDDRDLILKYYQEEKGAKIALRATLADQLTTTVNALRLRVHRILHRLRACVADCVGPAESAMTLSLGGRKST